MGEPRVRLDGLGAWVIKGNADQVDLLARFEADPRVGSWCVRPGYRARLMAAGQPVVFWASGSRHGRSGVWGVGVVTGPVVADQVPLDLTIDPPGGRVPRAVLRADPRLAGAEVFRQPQASNPSYLTRPEFAAMREHLAADRAGRPS
jgi:hypothetical protein